MSTKTKTGAPTKAGAGAKTKTGTGKAAPTPPPETETRGPAARTDVADWVGTPEACVICGGISAVTLMKWRRRIADFPRPFRAGPGGRLKWSKRELAEWMETRRTV